MFPSATSDELDELEAVLKQLQPDINCTAVNKATLSNLPGLLRFLDHCCRTRHYSFSILKCGSSDCIICKPLRLTKEIFNTLHHIPDPIWDGDVYKPFSEVYGTDTTEEGRLTLKLSA